MDSRPAVSFRGRESEAGRGGDREREGRGGVRERKEETEQERCRAELTVSGWTRRPHLLCRRDYCCISYNIQTRLHRSPSKVCQVLASFCGARWGADKHPTDLALLIQQLPRCLKELEGYLDVCNILGGLTDVGCAPTFSVWTSIRLWETLLCWKSKSCTCGWKSLIKLYDSGRY